MRVEFCFCTKKSRRTERYEVEMKLENGFEKEDDD